MQIQPKFDIGQTVYVASCEYKEIREQCPDCLGTKIWQVLTPKGETWDIDCGNCKNGWSSDGTITRYEWLPIVQTRTIGSIRIDTNQENPIEYMMEETGIGSGQLYDENNVFLTYNEALSKTQILVTERINDNQEQEHERKQYRKNASKQISYEEKKIQTLEKQIKKLNKIIEKAKIVIT